MTAAYRYPDGRPMRAGVRADGSYLPTVHGRTALALDTRGDDVRHAVALFRDWTGATIGAVDVRRLAHLIGCGFPPSAAAAREYAYRMGLGARGRLWRTAAPHGIGM
jgi:hypothetical protein